MRYLFIVLMIILSACQTDTPTVKEIDMYNASGDMVGTAKLSEQTEGINIKLKLEGLTPGFHGAHIHEFAKCDGPDFKSAGNHFNPDGMKHGLMNPDGPHLGDLPNIEADASGLVDTEVMVNEATFKDTKKSLLRGEGTSLIITAGQDDGVSQPGGNAGERIVCGLIKHQDSNSQDDQPTDPTQFNDEGEGE